MKKITTLIAVVVCLLHTRAQSNYNLDLLGELDYGGSDFELLSGIWGYTDDDGSEYALVTYYQGLSIVDLQDPANPEELFFVQWAEGIWHEAQVWDHYAYISSESAKGVLIVNLENLPLSIDTTSYHGPDSVQLISAHTLWIDEKGYCYLNGYSTASDFGGAYVIDVATNPWNPVYIGKFSDFYFHDSFTRNDTLWAAQMFDGSVAMYDVADRTNFVLLGVTNTPAFFTHNVWPSDDGKYAFTTDETMDGFTCSYDMSNPTDMILLDTYKHGAQDSTIVHNVFYKDGFLINAHYTEGVTIVDVHKPDNMIETAFYDTYPFGPENIFAGVWGAYPYFQSGLMVVSDRNEGLKVFQPEYIRACYLEGTVQDEVTFENIVNAEVKILSTNAADMTNFLGAFKTGFHASGLYEVEVNAEGCETKIYESIELINAETYILEAKLDCGSVAVDPEQTSEMFSVFYDATNNLIRVQIQPGAINIDGFKIFETNGRLIDQYHETALSNELIIPNIYPGGAYIIQILCNTGVYTEKIILY
ncbi:MAG: choice-of-anchor B family protein [Chitinophagales bacterium]